MNILSIIGTRPNILKLDKELPQRILYSGQHTDINLKDIFFDGLTLSKPDYDLNETKLEKMIGKMRKIIRKEKPTLILVYGDTRSSLAGAIAAKEERIRLAHVEAGMRCFRSDMLEESNRVIIDHMSDIRFDPCQSAVDNLHREQLRNGIFMIGNVLFDTFGSMCPIEKTEDYESYRYLTIHRQENLNNKNKLLDIFEGLTSDEKIRFPVHPDTEKVLKNFKLTLPNIIIKLPPISYRENLTLISNARMVVTDSGGVQCEAYWTRRPCLLLRKETEWTDYVADGWIQLVDHDSIDIMRAMENFKPQGKKQLHFPEAGAKRKIPSLVHERGS